MVKTPPDASWVAGVAPGRYSIADVYIYNSPDFVQIGWYVGQASQLPYVTTPHVFFGEYYPGALNDELLRKGPALAWNTFYWFKIEFSQGTGGDRFNFFVSGAYQTATVLLHARYNRAAFNGETSHTCVRMDGRAYRHAAPTRILQALTYGSQGARWYFFADSYFRDPGLISQRAGDIATNYAYGHRSG